MFLINLVNRSVFLRVTSVALCVRIKEIILSLRNTEKSQRTTENFYKFAENRKRNYYESNS